MTKGIYKDKNGKWFIHTKRKGKGITIRGYNSKKEAETDYEFAIEKWLKDHDVYLNDNSYQSVKNDFLTYRSKILRQESLRKDITQFKYFDTIFCKDIIKTIYSKDRLLIIYDDIVANDKFSFVKKNQLILTFKEFSRYCYMTNQISKTIFDFVLLTFLPIRNQMQDRKDKRIIPISHFKALSSVVLSSNDNLFNLAIFVLYFGGLRISELLGLTIDDIDLENRKIKVQRQKLTNGSITNILKTTNSYREVPMTEDLYNTFITLKLKKIIFDYSHTTFKRKLKHYEKKANIPTYSAHEFRHTFCSNLASKITNISEVAYCSKIAGHTNSMFLNTYVKSLNDELEGKFFGVSVYQNGNSRTK